MVDLPQQAQDALAEAERIEQEMAQPATPPQDPDPPPAPPAPETPPAPDQQPEPPPPPPPEETVEHWKQKFFTIQGMHRQAMDQVKDLSAQLATLKAATPPAPEPKVEPPAKLVTDKDAEAYGEDLIDLIDRKAREVTAPLKSKIDELETENAKLKGTVDTVTATTTSNAQHTFLADLTAQVSDWQSVNVNPAFLEWCAGTDPLSGKQRQALLDDAVNQFDAVRVAATFNAWKATQPPPPAPVADMPNKPSIEEQITPGASHTPNSPPTPPGQTKVWDGPAIEQFYNAVARGDYKGNDAAAAAIEAEIDRYLSGQ